MKTLARREFARRDRLRVLEVLGRIDQDGADLFRESAIIRPPSDDPTSRVVEQDLDSLIGRKTELHRAIAAIRQGDVTGSWRISASLIGSGGSCTRARGRAISGCDTAGFSPTSQRDEHPTEQAALLLGRRAADGCEQNQRGEDERSLIDLRGQRCKNCQTLYQSAMRNLPISPPG